MIATGETKTLDVASYFRDPDGGALTYAAASSAASVLSVSLAGTTLTMVGVAAGTATVTVTARDPDGLTATQGFQVTVATPNRAPEAVVAIPNQTIDTGSSSSVDVSGNFRDPDGDALTYAATSSAPAVASASVSGSALTVTGIAAGTATVTVTARDPGGLTATQPFQVNVRDGGGGAGLRDDFASSASLSDWEIENADAAVSNGVLNLTNTTRNSGRADRWLEVPLTDWTIHAGVGRADPAARQRIAWNTGHSEYSAVHITVGPHSIRVNGQTRTYNYSTQVWVESGRRFDVISELSGTSSSIREGLGEVTDVSLSYRNSQFTAEAEGGQLFEVRLDGGLASAWTEVSRIRLFNWGDQHTTALFDWVEVTGEASGGGGEPDLVVQSPAVDDDTPDPGASFTFSATVRNRGEGRSGSTTLRYHRSSNATISSGDTEVGTDAVGALGADGSHAETIALRAPSQAGTYYYGACVDPVDGESATNNNCSDGVEVEVSGGGGGGREGECVQGATYGRGESCDVYGTDSSSKLSFTVLSDGRARLGFVTGGNRIVVTGSINGVTYHFVASHQGGGVWRVDEYRP
ncbi:MAG: hypothetical protein F4164_12835 [Gemmatimonadales bacterium]|nr:hypothetical protein [Gemmatimonadales bacterium]MYK02948.1 hypothetical protein [Candidatus Palauibacter ramosifaciens]